MTTLRLLCSAGCALMMLAGLAYLVVVASRMTRRVETGDRTP